MTKGWAEQKSYVNDLHDFTLFVMGKNTRGSTNVYDTSHTTYAISYIVVLTHFFNSFLCLHFTIEQVKHRAVGLGIRD